MLTAFATLLFLLALGLAAGVIAGTVLGSGDKIVAALKGQSLLTRPTLSTRPVVVRFKSRPAAAAIKQPAPRWRAAA